MRILGGSPSFSTVFSQHEPRRFLAKKYMLFDDGWFAFHAL